MSSLTSKEQLQAKARLLDKAKGSRLKIQPEGKKITLGTDEANAIWQQANYTGRNPNHLQRIKTAYPCHEIIIEMYNGPVFVVNTDRWGVELVYRTYDSLDSYIAAHGLNSDDMDGVHLANDIYVPGAKIIYYMEC